MRRFRSAAIAAILLPIVAATGISLASASATTSGPCGLTSTWPAKYAHVVWIVLENQSAPSIYGNPTGKTPYMSQLANQCGHTTDMHGEFKPSAPNYVAMASGGNQGLTSDANPTHSFAADNIFHQVDASGQTWGTFSSRMPDKAQGGGNCWTKNYPSTNPYYTAHHEAAPYFSDIWNNGTGTCSTNDVPLNPGETGPLCQSRLVTGCADTQTGTLAKEIANGTWPNFVDIGPADDGGNRTLGGEVDPTIGDMFLQRWLSLITSTSAYQHDQVAIFITWDEDGCFTTYCKSHPTSQTIPTILVAPSIPAGTASGTAFNHYSMLKTTEQMLGITTYLGNAASATSMRSAFHW